MVQFLALALHGLPENTTEVGRIEILLVMGEDGVSTSYGFDGMDKAAAIGYLIVVLDRMREERKYEWDTCPDCMRPWDEHGEADEDDD